MLAIAGIRQLIQNNVSAGAGADTTYTVVNENARRVILLHLSAGAGDIRFNINALANANTIPIIPQRYFVVDARGAYTIPAPPGQGGPIAVAADVLHFFNTSGSPVTVYIMEIE